MVLCFKNIGGASGLEICRRTWHRPGSNEYWICAGSAPSANSQSTSKFLLEIIKAFENSSANGRYLLVGKSISHPEALQLSHKLYPSINCPINATATEIQAPRISKSRAESLGVSFMPLEVSLKDTIESLMEKNFLTL